MLHGARSPHSYNVMRWRRPKIVEGRVAKTLKTMALLEQPFIKDTNKNVASVVKEAVAALGENIQIRRFEK